MSPPAHSLPCPSAPSLRRLHCCPRSLPLWPLAALARACLPPASALPGGWTSWQLPAHWAPTAVLGLPPPPSSPPPPPHPLTPRGCRRLPPLPPPQIHARHHIRDVEWVRPRPLRCPCPSPCPSAAAASPLRPASPLLCLSSPVPSLSIPRHGSFPPLPRCRPRPFPPDRLRDVPVDAGEVGCRAAPACMRATPALTAGGWLGLVSGLWDIVLHTWYHA